MTVWMIWVQSEDYIWLEAAWSDDSTSENPLGWQEEVLRVREMCSENDYEMRITQVEVRGVHQAFEIPELTAVVKGEAK